VRRLALIGEAAQIAACAHEAGGGGVEPFLLDSHVEPGPMLDRLASFSPDVIVTFQPELALADALAKLDAVKVAYLIDSPVTGELESVRRGSFDRVIAADAAIAGATELAGIPVWRVLSLPVADRLYRPAGRPAGPVRALRVGRGLRVQELESRLDGADVAVNIGGEHRPASEHTVLVCMAAGLLILSEPLSSIPGLEPDVDFVSIEGERQLLEMLETLRHEPAAFHRQRLGGRMKAERMRASSVWSRVFGDLGRDLAAFGRGG
jgi:hypothetical protein